MAHQTVLEPAEILQKTIENGQKKAALPINKMLLLGFAAGAYIAFASFGSTMVSYNLLANPNTYGLGRALAGAIFGTGLMLVVLCGAELFTGNTLILAGVLTRKVSLGSMLKNWLFVYIGNFAGSVLLAFLVVHSGLLGSSGNLLGAITVKIAAAKTALPFSQALILGVLCNWLVCLAVWMSTGARSTCGKMMAIFFPIWLFIASGFEHSIANMFYIAAGIFAKTVPEYLYAAQSLGLSPELLAGLNWQNLFITNLLPVTLGNLLGGGVLVAGLYWLIYHKKTVNSK